MIGYFIGVVVFFVALTLYYIRECTFDESSWKGWALVVTWSLLWPIPAGTALYSLMSHLEDV